jgi:chaperonin GroES
MAYASPDMDRSAKKDRLRQLVEADNIAELLMEEDGENLVKIGQDAFKLYELDESSEERDSKREKWDEAKKIAKQVIEKKNTPYENSSNVKFPLLTTAAIEFNARAYPGIVSDGRVAKPKYYGKTSPDADREQMQAIEQQAAQLAQSQPTTQAEMMQLHQALSQIQEQGQAVMEEIQRFEEKQARGERVCEYQNWQLFNELDGWETDTDNLLLRVSLWGEYYRKIWQQGGRLYCKILSPEQLVFPSNGKDVKNTPRSTELFELYPHQIETKIRTGVYCDFTYDLEEDEPLLFIEQHCRLDLDKDGYAEPYIVIVETANHNVVRIQANYDLESIHSAKLDDIDVVKEIVPQQYYIKYPFIPSLDDGAFLCTGLFDILYPINDAVDTSINMLLDAGKAQLSPPGS